VLQRPGGHSTPHCCSPNVKINKILTRMRSLCYGTVLLKSAQRRTTFDNKPTAFALVWYATILGSRIFLLVACEYCIYFIAKPLLQKKCHVTRLNMYQYIYTRIYPTRCNFTRFIISGNCFTCFGCYSTHHQERINCVYSICYSGR